MVQSIGEGTTKEQWDCTDKRGPAPSSYSKQKPLYEWSGCGGVIRVCREYFLSLVQIKGGCRIFVGSGWGLVWWDLGTGITPSIGWVNVQSLPWSFFFAFLSIVISCPPHFGTCCGAGLELVSSYSPLPSKAGRQRPLGAVRGDAGPPDGQRLSPPAAGNLWGPIFCASPTGDAKASPVGCNDGTSWMYCFLAYIVMREPDPNIRDMLAYARLIIREALRHGGSGWLDYDRVFRQQAAIDHSLRWNSLHPGIQASTLIGHAPGTVVFCTLCREPDHTADQCALTCLQSPTSQWPLLRVLLPAWLRWSGPDFKLDDVRSLLRAFVWHGTRGDVPWHMQVSACLCNMPTDAHGSGLRHHAVGLDRITRLRWTTRLGGNQHPIRTRSPSCDCGGVLKLWHIRLPWVAVELCLL